MAAVKSGHPVEVKTFQKIIPMIYAYSTPEIPLNNGWIKIGYTEKQTVKERIKQQSHILGVTPKLLWQDNAMYSDGSGEYFTDHDFHSFLEVHRQVERRKGTEWFRIGKHTSKKYFEEFAARDYIGQEAEGEEYILRKEQQDAVEMTKAYFEKGGKEFLWNAKPRFGKTLTAYDLIRRMGFSKVLIVTNRPAISDSWADDFRKFIGWRGKLDFVSDNDALKGRPGVLTRDEYLNANRFAEEGEERGMVAFESLQSLKGSKYFGGEYEKLKWIYDLAFDLLIVDEAQEGVDTIRTDTAFRYVKRNHTLYLSGTPFKALASEQFSRSQIYNWSYADEQEAKANWSGEDYNPYERLPRLSLYTYQLSPMIYDEIQRGIDLSDDDTVDFAFDLNEFFLTNESGKFVHEAEIIKFLHVLSTGEKYPYSTPELRRELSHTLWLLNRVASAKALAKLLKDDPVFREYEIVLAAGDGKLDDDVQSGNEASLDKVRTAIAQNEKTITLSVGQLTVGVTIPEWSGVLMLCNLQSPSSYMQAAFRAQNPCTLTIGGKRFRKETAYVFDFDPARTLIIFDEFANNLKPETAAGSGTGEDRKENIRRLLNFFPVLGEDEDGRMVELDAAQVLSIPRRLKCTEVVRHGFMSNFLFQNIGNVFGAPGVVREIMEKLTPAHEEKKKPDQNKLSQMENVPVNEKGEVEIPDTTVIGQTQNLFGKKIYETLEQAVQPAADEVKKADTPDQVQKALDNVADTLKEQVSDQIVNPTANEYGLKKSAKERVRKQAEREIDRKFSEVKTDYDHRKKLAESEREQKLQQAETQADVQQANTDYTNAMQKAMEDLQQNVQQVIENTVKDTPKEIVRQMETKKAEAEKRSIEDEVRAHLRGFARTIPSFIMAYGNENLTLRNFDDYTEDDVFLEVTGITEDEFRFLRDGGDYTDENGNPAHFAGNLFDETVFDDSVAEFLHKKQELADYFDESKTEDIFDYIPPQKTNQIFTPKWVVEKMADELERENPGCFDDPTKTFADLYMKSGLYITEIVKRLYRSEKMKQIFPDDRERIHHIMEHQVYGMAPTRIIWLIATNYILGFDEDLKAELTESGTAHFVQADAAEAAKTGTLEKLVEERFG